jgi:predicted dehydrogenase
MSKQSRRGFLKSTLAAAATVTIAGTKSSGRVLGANDTVRVGVAGLNSRGKAHVDAYSKMKNVEVVYLIDPDTRTFAPRLEQLGKQATKPTLVQDIRKALEDKNLDAVSVATPNHWHALITIWACQAGKDVYVEKPCSHEVHEGRLALTAARKHNRIVQHGTQSRSSKEMAHIAAIVKEGTLGKLNVSRGLCYKPRKSIGFKPNEAAPTEVDFNLWLGPAPVHEFNKNLVHYNWHWFWDFGNGDIGNQGVHQMDIARWMIPGAKLPRSVQCLGGRFGYKDQGETPNSQVALFDYGDTKLIFEVRGLPTDKYHDVAIGNTLHFDGGMIAEGKFFPKGSDKAEPLPKVANVTRGPGGDNHFANFIAAVQSRKVSDLNADIEEGHYSSALCHLANISYRLGEHAPFVPQSKALGDDKQAYDAFERLNENLHVKNKLKLDELSYQIGRKLTVNPETESFVDDKEADKQLSREYRKPFAPTMLAKA